MGQNNNDGHHWQDKTDVSMLDGEIGLTNFERTSEKERNGRKTTLP
jgi:hypothetical protein